MSVINAPVSGSKSRVQNTETLQISLEDAILAYQAALETGEIKLIDKAYEKVCNIYPPLNFIRVWFKKGRYLYDTREDFVQDYHRIFCTSLAKWKPRHLRKESRYGGTGAFKNFFWSALRHEYSNLVKKTCSGKRSLSSTCPICQAWCNPLSTHLLQKHPELLWDQLESYGLYIEDMETCPFCKSHRIPKTNNQCEHPKAVTENCCAECLLSAQKAALRRHIHLLHSTYLFERFQELYPDHVTYSSKPLSVNQNNDTSEEEFNIYDVTQDESTNLTSLLESELSEIQRKMIERVFNGAKQISYSSAVYNCTQDEFQKELDHLKSIMSMHGLGDPAEESDDMATWA